MRTPRPAASGASTGGSASTRRARGGGHTDVLARLLLAALVTPMGPTTEAIVAQTPPAHGPSDDRATTADARLLQAIDLYTGVAGRVDDDEARTLLEAAAEDPTHVLARMWMARVRSRGRMTFEHDTARARSIASGLIARVRGLAAAGDVEALFLMGTAYDEGLGVPVDHPEAMRWYRRAADHGHVLAAHNVGNMYRDGRGVAAEPEAAVRWWLRAARAGDAIPALRLGESFEAGRGVRPDVERARYWYGRAAQAGNEDAEEALRRLEG